jgi:hypothetical protein
MARGKLRARGGASATRDSRPANVALSQIVSGQCEYRMAELLKAAVRIFDADADIVSGRPPQTQQSRKATLDLLRIEANKRVDPRRNVQVYDRGRVVVRGDDRSAIAQRSLLSPCG